MASATEAPTPLAELQAALKLIRTATLTIEVDRFDEAATRTREIAEGNGGYVSNTRVSRSDGGRVAGSITLRVPADRYAACIAALQDLGQVDDEHQTTQDITKAYTDLETRLAVKRQTAQRLREILRSRTGDLSDVLQVERELARVIEETERMEGERRYYDQQIALSTITVNLHEPGVSVGDNPLTPVFTAVRESVRTLATSLGVLIYAIAYLAPWLVLAAVAWWLIKRARSVLAKPRS
jgi:hypothetical protein